MNPTNPFTFDYNQQRYVMVETCISDPNTDVRNRSDRMDIGFQSGYFPIKLKFDPEELDEMYWTWKSCFDKEDASDCLDDVIERYNSVCPGNSQADIELEWRKQQQLGEFGVWASYDIAYWSPRMSAIALAHTEAAVDFDQFGNLISYRKLSEMPGSEDEGGGIHFNLLG